jgi:ferredoxin
MGKDTTRRAAAGSRLRVNPVACDGIGICAYLAPDLVRLDSWGFPMLSGDALTPREQRQARRAMSGCPHRALFLTDPTPPDPPP